MTSRSTSIALTLDVSRPRAMVCSSQTVSSSMLWGCPTESPARVRGLSDTSCDHLGPPQAYTPPPPLTDRTPPNRVDPRSKNSVHKTIPDQCTEMTSKWPHAMRV